MIKKCFYQESSSKMFHYKSIIVFAILLVTFTELPLGQNALQNIANDTLIQNIIDDSLVTLHNNNSENRHSQTPLTLKIPIFIVCAIVVSVVSTVFGIIILPIEIIAFFYTLANPDLQIYIPIIGKYILLWQAI